MALADDIAKLRQGGQSDVDILNKYKSFDPSKSGDIDRLIAGGKSPSDVLDKLSAYESQYPTHEEPGVLGKLYGAVAHGVKDVVQGDANTIDKAVGPNLATQTLNKAADAIVPQNYESASEGLMDPTKKWTERLGYVPRFALEQLPGIAQDMTIGRFAGKVGTPANFAGQTASGTFRSYGNLQDEAVKASGDNPNAPASWSNVGKAATAAAVNGALGALANKVAVGGPIAATSASSLAKQLAPQVGKGALVDFGASGVSDAATQAIINGKVDPDRVLASAVGGAGTGAAIRGAHAGSDVTNMVRMSDVDPTVGPRLAEAYRNTGVDMSDTKGAYQAATKVDAALDKKLTDTRSDLSSKLKQIEETSGFTDKIDHDLNQVETKIKNGEYVKPDDINALKERVQKGGKHDEDVAYFDTLEQKNLQNKLKALGNFDDKSETWAGGFSGDNLVNTLLNPFKSKYALAGTMAPVLDKIASQGLHSNIVGNLTHAAGVPSWMVPVVQAGAFNTLRAIDHLTGFRNPGNEFMKRVGESTPLESAPSFRQEQVERQAREAAAAEAAKAESDKAKQLAQEAEARMKRLGDMWEMRKNSQALEERQAQDAKAAQERQDKAEADRRKAELANQGRIWKIRKASEEASATDARLPRANAKLKAQYEKQRAKADAVAKASDKRQAQADARDDTLQARVAGKAEKVRQAEGKTQDASPSDTVRIRHQDQTVERPREPIDNLNAYTNRVQVNMAKRAAAIAELKQKLGKEHHAAADELLSRYNGSEGKSLETASAATKNFIKRLPGPLQAKAKAILNKPDVRATFKDK